MTLVVAPVRYPLTPRSHRTLEKAIDIADERDATLTVLHVNLYQNGRGASRTELKEAVEREFGRLEFARYVVRKGFLVEESILEEVAAENADVVVIGTNRAGKWRRVLRRFTDNPDIEQYLRTHLDCEVITIEPQEA